MAKSIMIQGTGSNVGKSMIVAGLARAYRRRGLDVAPFKPQNMSNNAAVTEDGGEIGRAQALQARAAGRRAISDMNPVLLKPETDTGAQIIVQGQRFATLSARDFGKIKHQLLPKVLQSFYRLGKSTELVLVEGAGSPAETNLRAGDIANMGFAQAADIPVVLTGDIDRGGVIAQIVGTKTVMSPADKNRVKGFIINKFRGDPALFDDGLSEISRRCRWTSLGVLPWFDDAWKLPAEDVLDITTRPGGAVKIAVPRLQRIANFDDLDPLISEPEVSVVIIEPGQPLPGDAQLVLIPGSKSTIADLAKFRENGWDIDLAGHVRRGGHVLGLCAGYQMLGQEISDPEGVEGPPATVQGLGLLDIRTVLTPRKSLTNLLAADKITGLPVAGYEIHIGQTDGPDCRRGRIAAAGHNLSSASASGRVSGCYLHGLFSNDAFRRSFLQQLGAAGSELSYESEVDTTLDRLADHIEKNLDLDAMLAMAGDVG